MRGVTFLGNRQLEVREFPDPSPGPEDVVIEVRASGMCGSDLHQYRSPRSEAPKVIAGHEPSGVVVAVGEQVPPSWVGRRVMVHHYVGCGRCDQCQSGWSHLCREGLVAMGYHVDGGHAQYARVPFRTVLPMPDEVSFPAAAAISCGTGTAWGALELMNLRGDDTIAVFGQGPVGLSATLLGASLGARVIALDIDPQRLDRARAFGATECVNPNEVPSVREAVLDLTRGRGVSKSLDTSGAPAAVNQVLDVLDLWGVGCWVGRGAPAHVDITDQLSKQITARTSWTLSIPSMGRLADFVAERGIDIDALFTDKWTLANAAEAYKVFDAQKSGKGVFLPTGDHETDP